jgi:NhaA family Na+:H+ antiporter
LGIRQPLVYGAFGIVVWLAFLNSGIHATIAGVLVAMTIPARSRIDGPTFLARIRHLLQQFEMGQNRGKSKQNIELQESTVLEIEDICEQVQAPLQKIEHSLNSWVSFLVMPIFAFANAGVTITLKNFHGESLPIVLGILVGLTVGKPIGISLACWLSVRAGIATLPAGVSWRQMIFTGVLAGIGFTMSIFIASLAFSNPDDLVIAKISILVASAVAGTLGILLLSGLPPAKEKSS